MLTAHDIASYNQQYLNEIWALPFNTYQAAELDGMKLYSSDTLKRKFIEAMADYSRTKKIVGKIERLVEKKNINPVWLNKGMFKLSLFKIFAPRSSKNILGFYTPKEDQIYLLLDNNITFGYASNDDLGRLMMHESMHMAATHLRNRYINLFQDEITSFYKAMYSSIFKIEVDITKECQAIAKFVFKEFEFKPSAQPRPFLSKYSQIVMALFKNKTTLSIEVFEQYVRDFISFQGLYFNNIDSFINSVKRSYPHIYGGLRSGYEKGLKVKNRFSMMVQELFYPSEIICMYAELTAPMNLSKVYKAFNAM